MNVQQIIDRARRLAYVSDRQYNDDRAIEDFNIVYSIIVGNIINQLNEDYFWDVFTTTSVDGQNEYTIPSSVIKIKEVKIGGHIAEEISSADVDENLYTPISPAYYISDDSIFIVPTPKGGDTIEISGIKGATDLLITDTEENIIIPSTYHYLIAEGMVVYIYAQRGLINEKNDAINTFNMSISDMIANLTDRNVGTSNGGLPDLSYFE